MSGGQRSEPTRLLKGRVQVRARFALQESGSSYTSRLCAIAA